MNRYKKDIIIWNKRKAMTLGAFAMFGILFGLVLGVEAVNIILKYYE